MQIFIAVKLGINWITFTATARASFTTRIVKYFSLLTDESNESYSYHNIIGIVSLALFYSMNFVLLYGTFFCSSILL